MLLILIKKAFGYQYLSNRKVIYIKSFNQEISQISLGGCIYLKLVAIFLIPSFHLLP